MNYKYRIPVLVAILSFAAFVFFCPAVTLAASGDIELVSPPTNNIYTQNDGLTVLRNTTQSVLGGCGDAHVATIFDSVSRLFVEEVNLVPGGCDGSSHNTSEVYSGIDANTIVGTYDVLDRQCPTSWDEDLCLSAFTASVQVSFAVVSATLAISPNLVDATVNTAYLRIISSTGGVTPFTWSVSSGSLPSGLSLDSSTGVISGTTTATGISNFTIQVTDNNSATDTQSFSLVVNTTPSITTTMLVHGQINTLYSQTPQRSGGTAPFTWSVTSGSLPTGISLNSTTGQLLGFPSVVATSSFMIQLTDVNGATATQALVLAVDYVAPTIATTFLAPGQVDIAYNTSNYYQTIQILGGTRPLEWSVASGSLPAGLFLDSSTGQISGTPTIEGVYNFILQVTDSDSGSDDQEITLDIDPQVSGVFTLVSPPAGNVYTTNSGPINMRVTGRNSSNSCPGGDQLATIYRTDTGDNTPSEEVNLVPGGCTGDIFSTADVYSGADVRLTPGIYDVLNGQCPGSFTESYCLSAFAATAAVQFSFTVTSITITTISLPDAAVEGAYSQYVQAAGGTAPLMWSIASGTLPSGLFLSSSAGEISGTPTAVETANFIVQVTDANNNIATKDLSIVVHGNTLAGSDVTVGPLNGVVLTFAQVTQEGQATVTTSSGGQPPPTGFKLGTPPTYYSISTTAQFTAPVEVCISWTQGQFSNENNLKLFHSDGTNWINVTTLLDTVNNVICGLTNSFSDFAILEKKQMEATIDIKPGSYPNSINLGSNGTIPVAIFSTSEFDATTIDPLSVTLASAPVKLKGNGTATYSFQDVNGDGLLDMVVHVSTETLQLSSTDELANLVGFAGDTEVIGNDTVRIVP